MSALIRIGVIGAGSMGRNHVRILSAEKGLFEFAGFYDASPDRAADIARQFSVRAFSSAEELMAQVDAVVIAAPSFLHHSLGLMAAQRGLHALVEKPLALTLADASQIMEAFSKAGRTLAVGHVERFNPVVTELCKLLRHEKPVAIEVRRYSPFDTRIGDADVVQDLMIHDIDLVCNLFAAGEHCVVSSAGSVVKSGRLDLVNALLRFDGGLIATLSASRVTESKIREIAVHTRESYIMADLLTRSLSVTRNTNMVIDDGQDSAYRQDSVTQKIFVPMIEPLRAELMAFHDCMESKDQTAANGAAACHAIAIEEEIARKALLCG